MGRNTICLSAEVYVSDDFSNQDNHIVVVWTEKEIHMTQCRDHRDGEENEHRVIIYSEEQARSMVMAIKAMAAASGWDI